MPEEPADAEVARLEERYARRRESLIFARLADAYRKGGRLGRALEVIEEGLGRHPDYLSARVVRARVLRDLGSGGRAVRAFESVLELDPFNLVALRALAEMAEERAEPEEARRWGRRLLEAEPLDPEARRRMERLERKEREEEPVRPDDAAPMGEGDRVVPEREGEPPAAGRDAPAPGAPESEPVPTASADGEDAVAPEGPRADPSPEEELAPAAGDAAPGASEEGKSAGEGGEDGAAEEEPDDGTPVTATMAELYMTQGLYEEALRIYRRLLEHRPDDPVLLQKAESARILSGRPRRPAPAEEPGRGLRKPDPVPAPDPAAVVSPARPSVSPAPAGRGSRAGGTPGGPEAVSHGRSAEAEREDSGREESGRETIRSWLHALLEGAAEDFTPQRPRPTALDVWLDRSRAD